MGLKVDITGGSDAGSATTIAKFSNGSDTEVASISTSGLSVTGTATVSSTLNVTGATTFGTAGITTGNITTGNITTGNITNLATTGTITTAQTGAALSATTNKLPKVARVALAAARTGGGVLGWANPEGVSILINSVMLDITTQSTGASTIDVGTTATNATTSSDNLIDGVSGAAIALVNNGSDGGTNGKTRQKLASGKWVTASEASGDVTGIAGYAYIEYWVL